MALCASTVKATPSETVHGGLATPMLSQRWSPGDVDHIFFDWSLLQRGEGIEHSSWEAESWTMQAQYKDQKVHHCGRVVRATGALMSAPHTPGLYKITNRVRTTDGREYARSVWINVR